MYSTCILTDDYLNFNRRKVDIGGGSCVGRDLRVSFIVGVIP